MLHSVKCKFRTHYEEGAITSVASKIKQVFHRLNCDSIQDIDDFRFNYFVKEVKIYIDCDLNCLLFRLLGSTLTLYQQLYLQFWNHFNIV